MPIATHAPDLELSLRLDHDAPRAARFHVARVDRPSPDLRDAVKLLTSELVTRAVALGPHDGSQRVMLSVWMPPDVVRVELRAPRELLAAPAAAGRTPFDEMLLERVADRWSVDLDGETPRMWFEIDRRD